MKNFKSLKPLTLSRHKTAKSAIVINGTYQNIKKLISDSPLELWNIVNHPSKYKRQFIGKPEFLKLKKMIEGKYPDLHKKHDQKHAIKCQIKRLQKSINS